MFRMPISGIEVEFRRTTGHEDLLLLESHGDPLSTSIRLVERLAQRRDGETLNAAELPLADLEAMLLELRRSLIGDTVASRGKCPRPECATPIDVSFSIADYLRSHDTRRPADVTPLESRPEWFEMRGRKVQFRLVTAADLAAAAMSSAPELELVRRTIRVASAAELKRNQRRVQKAMEQLAPPFSGEIEGQCPECGERVNFWFDVPAYVLRELRFDAELLYEDINQLAMRYHWSEREILDLPRQRRMQYVELALLQGGN
jgi:hypothetical protein